MKRLSGISNNRALLVLSALSFLGMSSGLATTQDLLEQENPGAVLGALPRERGMQYASMVELLVSGGMAAGQKETSGVKGASRQKHLNSSQRGVVSQRRQPLPSRHYAAL